MDKRRRCRLCCCLGGYNITIESNGMRLAGYKTLQQSRNTYTRPSFNETTANKQPDHDKPLSWWWWWWCSLQVCLFVTTIQPHRRSQMENSDAPEISLGHKRTRTKLSWNILLNRPHTSRIGNQRARHSFSCENSSCRCVERPNEPHPYKSYIEFCPLPLFCCVGWTFRTVGKFLTLISFDRIIKQVTILINFDYFTLKSN